MQSIHVSGLEGGGAGQFAYVVLLCTAIHFLKRKVATDVKFVYVSAKRRFAPVAYFHLTRLKTDVPEIAQQVQQ